MSKWLVSYMSVNGLDSYKVPPKCVTEVIQIPDHETPVDWFLRESQRIYVMITPSVFLHSGRCEGSALRSYVQLRYSNAV